MSETCRFCGKRLLLGWHATARDAVECAERAEKENGR